MQRSDINSEDVDLEGDHSVEIKLRLQSIYWACLIPVHHNPLLNSTSGHLLINMNYLS